MIKEENEPDYYVDQNIISEIMIMTDKKNIIQVIYLCLKSFKHLIPEVEAAIKDKTTDEDYRKRAKELLLYMNEREEYYDFYFNLFKDAFGKPEKHKNNNYQWTGENITLLTDKKENRIIFYGKNTEEAFKMIDESKAKKAADKF